MLKKQLPIFLTALWIPKTFQAVRTSFSEGKERMIKNTHSSFDDVGLSPTSSQQPSSSVVYSGSSLTSVFFPNYKNKKGKNFCQHAFMYLA